MMLNLLHFKRDSLSRQRTHHCTLVCWYVLVLAWTWYQIVVACSHTHLVSCSQSTSTSTSVHDAIDHLDQHRLEYIKFKILNKIGLERAPTPSDTVHLRHAYEQLMDIQKQPMFDHRLEAQPLSSSDPMEDRDHTFSHSSIDRLFLFPVKSNTLIFNMTINHKPNQINAHVHKAVLNVKLPHEKAANTPEVDVHIIENLDHMQPQFVSQIKSEFAQASTFDDDTYETKSTSSNWLKYDFTFLFDTSIDQSIVSNRLLLFSVKSIKFVSAFITLEFENAEVVRPKRSVDCSASGNTSSCCREQFYVNFTSIGWHNWILQPSGYYANYCRGKCDVSHARYHHTSVLTKFSQVVSLCCSPREMSQISLIYVDEENFVFQKNLPNMVVESCDCA